MIQSIKNVYMVSHYDGILYNDVICDKKIAEQICAIAKDQGYKDAKVVSLKEVIEKKYRL